MAQTRIVAKMLEFEKDGDWTKASMKAADRKTERGAIAVMKDRLAAIAWQEQTLRHLIDNIAWQMTVGQIHVSRRLYQGTKGEKKLSKTNIESVVLAAEQFNSEAAEFALITDLSVYIQLDDLMVRKGDGSIQFVEVKEGEINRKIMKTIDSIINTDIPIEEILGDIKGNLKTLQQYDRNFKQVGKTISTLGILQNDKGTDIKGRKVTIVTPNEPIPRFDERFVKLQEQLSKNEMWAYDNIDLCPHIGTYKGPLDDFAQKGLAGTAEMNKNEYLLFDYSNVIRSLNRPLFTT